jgi:hypothetical protein
MGCVVTVPPRFKRINKKISSRAVSRPKMIHPQFVAFLQVGAATV